MTYEEAVSFLNSFINYEKKDGYDYKKSFKLERMKQLASLLGSPEKGIKSIHIAGTKGKGSTAAITYSILKSAGYKVGLYTSPHLINFRERIRINDSLIDEGEIAALSQETKNAVDKIKDEAFSFFEIYTALAYLYFQKKKVDFAVYETGLGGRLDATNIVEPLVCAITPISYEHTDKLGATLKEIAREKAGIIKQASVCVIAPQEKDALKAIEDVCIRKNAKTILVGRDILFEESKSTRESEKEVFSVFGQFDEYPLLEMKLLGSHQVVNAATAIGVIEALRFSGIIIPYDAIRAGVEEATWPARLEIVGRKPLIVLDGAQNRASAKALAAAVKRHFVYENLILVLGVSKDKDVGGILDELLPMSDSIVLTKSRLKERALEPARMKELIRGTRKELIRGTDPNFKWDVFLTSDVEEALNIAKSKAKPEDLILVTGSLFVVGEALTSLRGPEVSGPKQSLKIEFASPLRGSQ